MSGGWVCGFSAVAMPCVTVASTSPVLPLPLLGQVRVVCCMGDVLCSCLRWGRVDSVSFEGWEVSVREKIFNTLHLQGGPKGRTETVLHTGLCNVNF